MISLDVNGKTQELDADPATPLLYVLRDYLQLNGAKFGCGLGQCGACTVLVDGRAVLSCVTPISTLAGRRITTLEGLGTPEKPGRVQRAFIAEQAAQCGYCIPGMIMQAQALLERTAHPTSAEIRMWVPQRQRFPLMCLRISALVGWAVRSRSACACMIIPGMQ